MVRFFRRSKDVDDSERRIAEIEFEIKKLERRYGDLKERMRKMLEEGKGVGSLERDVIQSRLENMKMELNSIFESLKELFKSMKTIMLLKLMEEEKEFLSRFEYLKGDVDLNRVEREIEKEMEMFRLESEEEDDVLDMLLTHLGGGENVFEKEEGREEKVGDETEDISVEETSERGDEQIREVEE